jgi:hypothetical protein
MPPIYCGNNALDTDLVSGNKVIGTRYQCLRKGVGIGNNLPYDHKFTLPYAPIDTTKIYCGNSVALPGGYDRFGNLHQCMQKGVGVGKRLRANQGPVGGDDNNNPRLFGGGTYTPLTHTKLVLTLVIVSVISFVLLYITKPKYITKRDKHGKQYISWKKFLLLYVIILSSMLISILTIFVIAHHSHIAT